MRGLRRQRRIFTATRAAKQSTKTPTDRPKGTVSKIDFEDRTQWIEANERQHSIGEKNNDEENSGDRDESTHWIPNV